LSRDEPVLVMVTADKIEALRGELGADADRVAFVDMAEAGRNPGRIISRWNDFAAEHVRHGGRARGIGEPIWADRGDDELVECQHHESLINIAFEDADGFRLACPYDTESLPAVVIDEARRTHPHILDGAEVRSSSAYRRDRARDYHRTALPHPDASTLEVAFDLQTLGAVRRFIADCADEAGLSGARAEDIVLAVNEAASNSVRHGGGHGFARVWNNGTALVCEVRDRGVIDDPVAGRVRSAGGVTGPYGLWLAHHLCDLVQVRSSRRGSVVRLHMLVQDA
jgi:anti-sigma regulatory factor (Ser/Thr protein kinase)